MSSNGIIIEEDNKEQEEIIRFMQDLEFVQCLANPFYLKYLLYFKKAEYMKYITFERCIIFLELLQYKEFRQKFKENGYENRLDFFLYNEWKERALNINNENIIENNDNKDEDKEKDNKINEINDMDFEI